MLTESSMLFLISTIFYLGHKAIHLQISVMQGMIFNFQSKWRSASSLFEIRFRIPLNEDSICLLLKI